jgi:integrase
MRSKMRTRKPNRHKTKLGLPDLEHVKSAVIVSLRSPESQRSYRHSIEDFVSWYCSEPRLSFNKTVVNLYNRVLAPACDRIKELRVSWHSFRHTHATLLAESGESMKTAQALLGHSDLETTLNIYTHAIPASQRRAVERMSEVMFSIVLELGENEQEGKSN